jgi:hypothetical protein
MNIWAKFNREIEFETEEETFKLGERGECDYLYPAIQTKVDEHWKRIRGIIDAFAIDKKTISSEENIPGITIKMVPDEEKLYHKLLDVAEEFNSEMLLSVVKRIAKEMEESESESEEGSIIGNH